MSSIINAEDKNIETASSVNIIKDVYIGVFFDGTNNNMVQQAYFHTYKQDNKLAKNVSELQRTKYEECMRIISSKGAGSDNGKEKELSKKQKKEILEAAQVHAKLDVEFLHGDKNRGYSNIAILHSLIKSDIQSDNALYYNLYIEGSGAKDIATTMGEGSEGNINGLGFGLGKTGVTALVSKAVKYIRLYLISNSNYLNEDTKYHFLVFGFSRGATCARVFAELATRAEGSKLNREEEFGQSTSKVKELYKRYGRLPFMESDFLGKKVKIDRKKVTVDFLGIYDTVASIGFLKQKDGWTNTLSLGYRINVLGNYHENFHYMNASDYGLYSHHNSNVKNTLHICAADEFRENFALVNLGKKLPDNAMEIIIPGCHSDVGGGYVAGRSIVFILYKVTTRKKQRAVKGWDKIKPTLGMAGILLPGEEQLLKSEQKAKIFISDPMNRPNRASAVTLNADSLIKLGWVDKDYSLNKNLVVQDRVNDISFNREENEGYSNISLNMMLKCVRRCGITWLFEESTAPYDMPKDGEIKSMGEKMCEYADVKPNGERLWLMPSGGYSGYKYRDLRLKYLHFTSSCEILNEGILKPHMANFGNNCNYDNDVNICRIMYFGDKELEKDYKDNIRYMYEFENFGIQQATFI